MPCRFNPFLRFQHLLHHLYSTGHLTNVTFLADNISKIGNEIYINLLLKWFEYVYFIWFLTNLTMHFDLPATSMFLLCRFWWRVFWIVLRSCYSGSEGRSPSTSRSRSRAGPSAGCRYCTPERGTPRRTQSPASSSCLQRCVAMRAAGLVVAAIVVVIQIYFLCLNPSAALARPTRQSETHREFIY